MEIEDVAKRLQGAFPDLAPQVAKAAEFVLAQPVVVATQSMRKLAISADVPPTTMTRLAKAAGFSSYSDFKAVFERDTQKYFPDFSNRASSLQQQEFGAEADSLLVKVREKALRNLSNLFQFICEDDLTEAADILLSAQTVYVVGSLSSYSSAHYCHYIAQLALPNWVLVPAPGGMIADQIAEMSSRDAVIAIAHHPYSSQAVEAVALAKSRNAKLVSITDSLVSPLAIGVDTTFLVPFDSPQYFTSYISTTAIIELLTSYVVARGGEKLVERIKNVEGTRAQLGEYSNFGDGPSSKR